LDNLGVYSKFPLFRDRGVFEKWFKHKEGFGGFGQLGGEVEGTGACSGYSGSEVFG
jgi:hypothetical protein